MSVGGRKEPGNVEGPHCQLMWNNMREGGQSMCNDLTSKGGKARSVNYDKTCSLVGDSVWGGVVQSAAFEIGSRVLSMVCICTCCRSHNRIQFIT